MSAAVLAAAIAYAARGWRVVPLNGKEPFSKKWQEIATCEPSLIRQVFTAMPWANVGIVCDPAFGFVVDVDDLTILDFLPPFPTTLTSKTPRGGTHFVFKHPPDRKIGNHVAALRAFAKARGWVQKTTAKVDIRGSAGQIVVFPSEVANGRWTWVDPTIPVADAPQWLLDLPIPEEDLSEGGPAAEDMELVKSEAYTEKVILALTSEFLMTLDGERGSKLYNISIRLGELGVPLDRVEAAFMPACEINGLLEKDGIAKVRREMQRGWKKGTKNLPKEKFRLTVQVPKGAPPPLDDKPLEFPVVNAKGNPIPHIDNTRALLGHFGIVPRFNLMTHDDELTVPGFIGAADKRAGFGLATAKELVRLHGLPHEKVFDYHLTMLTADSPYHPVADWIQAKAWDGKDRIVPLFHSLTLTRSTQEDTLFACLRAWLATAARAALVPARALEGVAAQLVLVLQGDQGIRKTRWAMSLVPAGSGWAKEGRTLNPSSRDSVKQATSVWIVELGELDATFRKSDISALKAFITSRTDTYRSAYARLDETVARRTVFVATVNEGAYLHDETGSRRFATMAVTAADPNHGIDLQQLWAQAAVLPDEANFLTQKQETALREINLGHEAADPMRDLLRQTWKLEPGARVKLSEIMNAIDNQRNWTLVEQRAVARALRNDLKAGTDSRSGGYDVYEVALINPPFRGPRP